MRAKKSQPMKRRRIARSENDAAFPGSAAWLALAAPLVAPPPRVKEQLLARVRLAGATASAAMPPWRFESLRDATGWVSLPLRGVRMRELSVDRARDTALLFVEMTPGAAFPDHEHTAA